VSIFSPSLVEGLNPYDIMNFEWHDDEYILLHAYLTVNYNESHYLVNTRGVLLIAHKTTWVLNKFIESVKENLFLKFTEIQFDFKLIGKSTD